MKRSSLSLKLFPLLASALLISLFLMTDDSDTRANKERAFLLLEIQETSGYLDREVLLITSLQQSNYDAVSKTSQQLRTLTTRLLAEETGLYDAGNPALTSALDTSEQQLHIKLGLLEQIKYNAALVRNGLNYLPQLVAEINATGHRDALEVNKLAIMLYHHYLSHNKQAVEHALADLDALQSTNQQSDHQHPLMANFEHHIRFNLDTLQRLSSLHQQYLDVPTKAAFSQLHTAYQDMRANSIQRNRIINMLLFTLATVLLIWLGFVMHKLSASHRAAEHARTRLRDGVDSLSEAFALFDQQQRLVLYNQQFINCYPWLTSMLTPGLDKTAIEQAIAPHLKESSALERDHSHGLHRLQVLNNGNCYLSSNTPTAEGGEVWVRVDVTHSRQNELELRKLSRAIEQSPVSVVITDTRGVIEYINPKAELVTGYNREEVVGKNPRIFKSDHYSPDDYQQMWQQLCTGQTWHGHFLNRRKNGEHYWEAATISGLRDEQNNITHFVAVKEDITERKRADEMLRMNAAVFETTSEGIMITDAQSRIISVNPAFTRITGYSLEDVAGKTPSLLRSGKHSAKFYAEMNDHLQSQGYWSGEIWNKRKDQTLYPQWLSISAVHDNNGEIQQFVAVITDITQRKHDEEQIRIQANYDALTLLPNRTYLERELQHLIRRSHDHAQRAALLFIDLDRFKAVNDTMGHSVGDELLQMVAQTIKQQIRGEDFIARFGGDEFVVLLPGIRDRSAAATVSQHIIQCLKTPFHLHGRDIFIGTSIGISIYPDDVKDADSMLRHADMAMYQAKDGGRDQYQFFSADMRERVKSRTEMEHALRLALRNDELELYYQPIVTADRVDLVEALVRWNHPTRGLVLPGEFIPLAEDTGLIQPLGLWVFEEACNQLQRWTQQGLDTLSISINISSSQRRLGFDATTAQQLIEKTGADPSRIIIEITESMFLDESVEAVAWLNALKALGIQLAIDDFGTGYSSLSYLKNFPIDKVKIDRSFVRDVPDDDSDASLVSAIIAMSHSIGLSLVAEGVETEAQRDFLEALKCDAMQGYLFSRPVPADQLPGVIAQIQATQSLRYDTSGDYII